MESAKIDPTFWWEETTKNEPGKITLHSNQVRVITLHSKHPNLPRTLGKIYWDYRVAAKGGIDCVPVYKGVIPDKYSLPVPHIHERLRVEELKEDVLALCYSNTGIPRPYPKPEPDPKELIHWHG